MRGQQLIRAERPTATNQLATAADHLEAALETVDLHDEPDLGDAVIDAIRATDRAYRRSTPQRPH